MNILLLSILIFSACIIVAFGIIVVCKRLGIGDWPVYPVEDEISFMTNDMILEDLWQSGVDYTELKNLKPSQVINCHPVFGRRIRNTYNMWNVDNPYSVLDDTFHQDFPDQRSQSIIHKLYARLHDLNVDDINFGRANIDVTKIGVAKISGTVDMNIPTNNI